MDYDPQCYGKTAYRNKRAAIERIRCQLRMKRRRLGTKRNDGGMRKGMLLSPYPCRACGAWHVGAASPEQGGRRYD